MAIIVMEYENPDVAAIRKRHNDNPALARKTESFIERKAREHEEAEEYRRAAIKRIGPRLYMNNNANTSSLVPLYREDNSLSYDHHLDEARRVARLKNEARLLELENNKLREKVAAQARAVEESKQRQEQIKRNAAMRANWDAMTAGTKSLDEVLTASFAQQFGDDMQDLAIKADNPFEGVFSSSFDVEPTKSEAELLADLYVDPSPVEEDVWDGLFTDGVVELKNSGYNPNHTGEEHFNRILFSDQFQQWMNWQPGVITSKQILAYVEKVMAHEEKVWLDRQRQNDRLRVNHKTGQIERTNVPAFRPGGDFSW
jgi:hypothetical protein